MARFHFDLRTILGGRAPGHPVARRALAAGAPTDEPEPDELSKGPGWFDSSWELVHGLEVREGLPANPSVNEWLTVCLAEL
jgi:hypothetical protein